MDTPKSGKPKKERSKKSAYCETASNEVLTEVEKKKSKDEAYKAILCLKENRLKNPISNVQF